MTVMKKSSMDSLNEYVIKQSRVMFDTNTLGEYVIQKPKDGGPPYTLATQRTRPSENGSGNCFSTSLACVVGSSMYCMPPMNGPTFHWLDDQMAAANKWLRDRNQKLFKVVLEEGRHKSIKTKRLKKLSILEHALPNCILGGPHPSGGYHAVVGTFENNFFRFVHDPSDIGFINWPPIWAIFVVPLEEPRTNKFLEEPRTNKFKDFAYSWFTGAKACV